MFSKRYIQKPHPAQIAYGRTFSKALRKARGRRKSLLGVSLTGMIDVVFNLLIFFVVITTVPQREGFLAGELPSASPVQTGMEVPTLPIMISVYAGNSFDDCQVEMGGFEQSPESFKELYGLLAGMHADAGGLYEADNPVVLNLGAGVSVDQMVKTYNAVVLAGFNNIQFVRSR
jgi:biopolymer transport protein ExbD